MFVSKKSLPDLRSQTFSSLYSSKSLIVSGFIFKSTIYFELHFTIYCEIWFKVHFCFLHAAAAAAKSLQSCPTLCDPIIGSPPGSPIPGILQARILKWVAISFSKAMKVKSEVAQSCLTLSDPMDCSLPGSSIHGICQARVLEWGIVCYLPLINFLLCTE